MGIDLGSAKLTFSDEFNNFSRNSQGETSVHPSKNADGTWTTHYWWGDGERTHGNAEEQFYSDSTTGAGDPFSISDGVLTIKAEPTSNWGASQGKPYVSGLMTTDGTFSQQYGYFEMRADLPSGQGLWPAFWMLNEGHTWPPELDIFEIIGSRPQWLEMTAHTGIGGHSTAGMNKGVDVGDMTQGFHTYGASVMPDRITWYFDGQEMFSAPTPDDLKQPLYLLANLAVGGAWPGSPDGSTPWPAEMKIDYIRAYQLPGTPGFEGGGGSSAPAPAPAASEPAPAAPADAWQEPEADAASPAAASDPAPAPVPAPAADAAPTDAGDGAGDTIVLRVSQDAWQEDARYTVSVDGVQQGDARTVSARHGAGSDEVVLKGDWEQGEREVAVTFLNDAYGGPDADRNLHVDSLTYNDAAVPGGRAALLSDGPRRFEALDTTESADADHTPASFEVGAGPDRLVLSISEDAWRGDAQYRISVDGQAIGGLLTARALRGEGTDTVTVRGDWGDAGPGRVSVEFVNDLYGGPEADRNLYVEGMRYEDGSGAAETLSSALTPLFAIGSQDLLFA